MAAPMADPDAVVARLSTAAARLKALQAQAVDAMASLELPSLDDVRVAALPARDGVAPPSRTDAALARLHAATASLAPMRAELGALRARMDELAAELRVR
jgi:multidrug resistance efflux pump